MKLFQLLPIISLLLFSACDLFLTNEKEIYIDHYLDTATGMSDCLTMRYKESLTNDWWYFYDGIDGFNFEQSYVYKLKVKTRNIPNPPADGSSIEYSLVEVLSKDKVDSSTEFDVKLKSYYSTWIKESSGNYSLLDSINIGFENALLTNQLNAYLTNTNVNIIIGKFHHSPAYDSYILKELITNE